MAAYLHSYRWVLTLFFTFFITKSYGQSITKYLPSSTSGTYATTLALSGGASLLTVTGSLNEGACNNVDIGFDFWYMGTKYNTLSVSTNGWAALGSTSLSNYVATNNLVSGGTRPVLAPLWDDLAINGGLLGLFSGGIYVKRDGINGSRVTTIEWYAMNWNASNPLGASMSFQLKLYEALGKIEFHYNRTLVAASNTSASIGITGTTNNSFISIGSVDPQPNTSTSWYSFSSESSITARPLSGHRYAFASDLAAPTNLNFTDVGASTITLNWSDNSNDELGFLIYSSTDNSNFTHLATTSANAVSYVHSGLTSGNTYYYRVYALREAPSAALSGSQVATCQNFSLLNVSSTNIIGYYRLNGSATDYFNANNGTMQGSPTLTTDRYGISGGAYNFSGSGQYVSTANNYTSPNAFTIAVWFKTTVAQGKLIGFGSATTGASASYDRHLYIGSDGKVYFGVRSTTNPVTIASPSSLSNDSWHHAAATLSPTGVMTLYIDGQKVAESSSITPATAYSGRWRLGYDSLTGWTNAPSSGFYSGALDDALIFHRALSEEEVGVLNSSPHGVQNNGTVCVGATLQLTGPAITGATYSWQGPDNFTSSLQSPTLVYSLAAAGTYTLTVNARGCSDVGRTKVVSSSAAGQWTGNTNTNWSTASNWCNGVVPTSVNISVPSSGVASNPTLTSAISVNNIDVQSGRSLTIASGGNLQIAGSITNAGSIVATQGKVTFNGTSEQVIPANTFSTNVIKDLEINNTAGVTLNGALSLTGILTANAGAFNTNGFLTLASSSVSTANVASIPIGASIQGNVNVERYVQGGALTPYRTYRMISSAVYDNTTTLVTADVEGNRTAKFAQLIDDMIITGKDGKVNGFDSTANNPAGAWKYDGGYWSISTINEAINIGRGMYVFFRGNRNNIVQKTTAPFVAPESVVIDFIGVLNQQDVTVSLNYKTSTNGVGFNLVGNPYASVIDWDSPNWGSDKVNIDNTIWVWNPATRSYATYTNGVGLLGGSRYIASGQSFFVKTTAAGSIKFKESIKAATQQAPTLLMSVDKRGENMLAANTIGSQNTPSSLLRIKMKPLASFGEDETAVVFKDGSNNGYNAEDALHLDGDFVNIATLADNQKLGINFLAASMQIIEIPIYVNASATGNYNLYFNTDEYFSPRILSLKDKYLNRIVPITSALIHNFNIDKANAQTFGTDRFSLMVEPPVVLPVNLTSFKAMKGNSGVLLTWTTALEYNNGSFKLYRSSGEGAYVFIASVLGKGAGDYSFLDASPLPGYNYYKLTQVDTDGKETEVGFAMANFVVQHSEELTVYPNPVIDKFTLQFSSSVEQGKLVVIYNFAGQKIMEFSLSKEELASGYEVNLSKLNSGFYIVKIEELESGEIIAVKKIIKK